MLVDACSTQELVEGRPTVVKVKGREIAVIQWRGEVHAVRNICPHQTQSLSSGHVRSSFSAEADRISRLLVDDDDPVLVCPVHTWSFSLRTGQCAVDEGLRVRRYDTVVADGRILIDVSA